MNALLDYWPLLILLTSGMAFFSNETAIQPDRVARAVVRLAGETSELKDRSAGDRAAANSRCGCVHLPGSR